MAAANPARPGRSARLDERARREARPERERRGRVVLLHDDGDAVVEGEPRHLAVRRPGDRRAGQRDGPVAALGPLDAGGRLPRGRRGGAAAVGREEVADRAGVRAERAPGHRLDVGRRQGADPVEVGAEIAPVADHRPVAELTRLRGHAVASGRRSRPRRAAGRGPAPRR